MTIPHPNTSGFSCHSPLWVLSGTQLKVQVSQIQVKNRLSPENATGNGCSPLYKSCSSVSGFLLVLWDSLDRSSRKLALDFSPWLSYHLHLHHDSTQENSTWPSRPGVLNAVITPSTRMVVTLHTDGLINVWWVNEWKTEVPRYVR